MIASHDDTLEPNHSSRQFSVLALVSVCLVLLGGLFVMTREYSDAMGRKKPAASASAKTEVAAQPLASNSSEATRSN